MVLVALQPSFLSLDLEILNQNHFRYLYVDWGEQWKKGLRDGFLPWDPPKAIQADKYAKW